LLGEALPVAAIEPVPENMMATVDGRTIEDRERWWKTGLKAIHGGKLAVLLLSGGQVCGVFVCVLMLIMSLFQLRL